MQLIEVRFVICDGRERPVVIFAVDDGGCPVKGCAISVSSVGFEELSAEDVNDAGEGAEILWVEEEVWVDFLF